MSYIVDLDYGWEREGVVYWNLYAWFG